MKPLIQKDLKENLKVALIGLLIFSLILLQSYRSSVTALMSLLEGRNPGQNTVVQPLLVTNLLTAAIFFCSIFGAVLGWLQTRNEAHTDLWAFLIHRPITRTEIFLSKSIAGLCLYIFATALPLAVLVAVVLIPGHVAAPFEWAMVLPLVSIFLLGVPFYFAGLLTGLRRARWYVSRAFGLGLAIIAALLVFGMPEFWQSLIGLAVATGILAITAWGAYQSGGFYRGQPVKGKLALVIAITGGCGVVLFAGLGLLVNFLLNPINGRSFTYSAYQMTRDGTIYKETVRDGEIIDVVDLEGHPPLDPVTHQKIKPTELRKQFIYGGSVFSDLNHHQQIGYSPQDPARFFRLVNVTDKTLWYLDHRGNLTGYDGRTRKLIGSLNPQAPENTSARQPFLSNANGYYYYNGGYNEVSEKLMPTDKKVYLVDFKERSATPIFSVPNDDEIGGCLESASPNTVQKRSLLTTRKSIILIDHGGKSVFTLPYQPGYSEYPQVQLSVLQSTETNFAVWFYPDSETNRATGWKMPIHVVWLGPEDTVTREADLPVLRQPETPESWSDRALATLLPPALHFPIDHKLKSVWSLLCLAWALLSAFTGFLLVKRYNFSTRARVGWTLLIFLLGVTGLLALLCTEEWPVRETCPNCKKLRTVDRESCEHCGSAFSPPEKNGSEIFAPLLKA